MDHSQASKLAMRIAAIYAGNRQTRAAALWDHCCDVVESLDELVPVDPGAFPPVLDRQTLPDVQRALNAELSGESDSLGKLVASAFSMWRNAVQQAEARSAGRLTVLVGALQRLYELGETAKRLEQVDTCAMVDAMVEHLEAHVRDRWRTAFPRKACPRAWPIVMTRRYDLLPCDWRYLSGVETRSSRRDRMHREAST